MQFDPARDDEANLRKLQLGRLDVAVMEKAVGGHRLRTLRIQLGASLRWGGLVLARLPLTIGFTIGPKQNYWARQFEAGYAKLRQSGRYRQLAHSAGLHEYLLA